MRYFITGGTGSLGHALTAALKAHDITVYSRDELKQAQMAAVYPSVHYVLGDVRDESRIHRAVKRSKPDVVIHAAALKRVDSVAGDPEEVYKTNIFGSHNVLCAATDVEKVILVSTDKACYPTNAYGVSKAAAERLFTAAKRHVIRYGNVLGSRGSVLEVWKNQNPLQITSVNMTRFWLTLPQAVAFILEALDGPPNIFVPRLKSSLLMSLARVYRPHTPCRFVGLRPGGEKLHETLITHEEAADWGVAPLESCSAPRYTDRELESLLRRVDYVPDMQDQYTSGGLRGS